MLRSLGHEDAAVLDGGYAAWLAAGLPTESALPVVAANEYTPISTSDATLVTTDELEERVARGALLLDARAPERFSGAVEPIDPVAGHIPGAVNLPFQALLSNGHFKPRDLLRAAFNEAAGGELPQDVVAMCGSGVTACHLLLAMEVAELGTGNLYAGSWSEWIRDPSRRVAVGN
jgi:thiosulfate/3-mercaptopyruvate sulfurtransferase